LQGRRGRGDSAPVQPMPGGGGWQSIGFCPRAAAADRPSAGPLAPQARHHL